MARYWVIKPRQKQARGDRKHSKPVKIKPGENIVKGTKKNVQPRDPLAPALPLSAFMFFVKDWRERIRRDNPAAISQAEQNKLLGSKWKELLDEDKTRYHAEANQDKDRYNQQMSKFKAKKVAGTEASASITAIAATGGKVEAP